MMFTLEGCAQCRGNSIALSDFYHTSLRLLPSRATIFAAEDERTNLPTSRRPHELSRFEATWLPPLSLPLRQEGRLLLPKTRCLLRRRLYRKRSPFSKSATLLARSIEVRMSIHIFVCCIPSSIVRLDLISFQCRTLFLFFNIFAFLCGNTRYQQVHSAPLDLLLPQTLLTHLMDAEGSLSEAGYLVATLEAAVSFITQVRYLIMRVIIRAYPLARVHLFGVSPFAKVFSCVS